MLFKLIREVTQCPASGESFTPGKLYRNGVFYCFTVEDEDRRMECGGEKVYGRTAIPRGKYKLRVSMSNRFKKELPEVMGVDGFAGVRIHGGNKAENSEGCVLTGKVRTSTGVANCADVVADITRLVKEASAKGEESWLEIA